MNLQLKGLDRALLMFDQRKVRTAASRAINNGLTTGRKVASQEIRKDWNLKAGRVDKELRKFKTARSNDLTAIIQAKGKPIDLIHFGAQWRRGRITTTGTKSTRAKKSTKSGGVFVKVRKRPSKKSKGGIVRLPHAFIATTRAGRSGTHIGVFERVGRNRLPIKKRSAVTIATMFNHPGVIQPTTQQIGDRMAERFTHHLNHLLK